MTSYNPLGPLVLAGSGEYTPAMDIVDRYLTERCTGPVILIATSCAQEGADMMTKWEQMGVEHFARLGIEATPLRIVDNADANSEEKASVIETAAVVWFSGGSPPYLAQSFHNTASWVALEAANRRGAAVAGASGGLGVLNDHMVFPDVTAEPAPNALGLAAPVRAMAHFDRMEQRRPEALQRILASLQPGQMAVGVDEDTAVVWTDGEWRAMGHKRVVVFKDGQRENYANGDLVPSLPPPFRALPNER